MSFDSSSQYLVTGGTADTSIIIWKVVHLSGEEIRDINLTLHGQYLTWKHETERQRITLVTDVESEDQ